MNEQLPKDTKYSWLIVAISFYGQIFSAGILFSFGPLYVEILKVYKVSETTAAWVGSVSFSICFLLGFLSSSLCSRFGCNKCMSLGGLLTGVGLLLSSFAPNIITLIITYGIIAATGMSLLFFSSSLVIPLYFNKKLTTANGIVSAGSCVSGLGLSPFLGYMNQTYGLQTTFQVLSTFLVVPCIVGCFIRRKSSNHTFLNLSSLVDKTLFKNRSYVLLVICMCIMMCFYYAPFVHFINFAELQGVSLIHSTFLISVLSAFSFFGKVIYGMLGQNKYMNKLYLFQFSILFMSVLITLLPLARTYLQLALFSACFGMADGSFISYVFVITNEVVKIEQLSSAFGLLHTITSLFSLAGAPIAGFLYETTKSYEVSFMTCGGAFIICALLLFVIPFVSDNDSAKSDKIKITVGDFDNEKDDMSLHDSGVIFDSDINTPLQPHKKLYNRVDLLRSTLNVGEGSSLSSNLNIANSMWSIAPHCYTDQNNNDDEVECV